MKYYMKDKTEGNPLAEDVAIMPLGTVAAIGGDGLIELYTPKGGRYRVESLDLSRWIEISEREYMEYYVRQHLAG